MYDHFWPFYANYMKIFHKSEVQTVILKWWTGLNLNWLKRYDTSHKYFHFNPSRKFDAPPYSRQNLTFSLLFLGELKTLIIPFEIKWPLPSFKKFHQYVLNQIILYSMIVWYHQLPLWHHRLVGQPIMNATAKILIAWNSFVRQRCNEICRTQSLT